MSYRQFSIADVAAVRMAKEPLDDCLEFLRPAECADQFGFEIVFAGDGALGDPRLEVAPDLFVGIEMR
jgi:hypothetical protein